jgi:spermidine/putrescine-binding protein
MKKTTAFPAFTRAKTAFAAAALILSGSIVATAPAQAAPTDSIQPVTFTAAQLSQAIREARTLDRVTSEYTNDDGDRIVTLDLGQGFEVDVVEPPKNSINIGVGSDAYGKWVSFNSFDQNVIYTGAGLGLTAGLCAISAGTFCFVASAIVAAAGLAVSTNAGPCKSNKVMRVYPFSGHKPRCV